MNRWLYKMQSRYGRYAIPSLVKYIVIIQGILILVAMFMPAINPIPFMTLDFSLVLQGQVWRLITFLFVPVDSGLFFILVLYFYYIIGASLEQIWGVFQFNLYFFTGVICAVLGAIVSYLLFGVGYANNYFLFMSMFFAFGILDPDFELRLFFFLPIKIKWIVLLDAAFFLYQLIIAVIVKQWWVPVSILFSFANIALFLGGTLSADFKRQWVVWRNRRQYNKSSRKWKQVQKKGKISVIRVVGKWGDEDDNE